MSEKKLQSFNRIPIQFDAYDPMKERLDYTEELGGYEWFLYQFKMPDDSDFDAIKNNESLRNSLPPIGVFESSRISDYRDFLNFLLMNYQGWAPLGKGMAKEKAVSLARNLISAFLLCEPGQAIYIEYMRSPNSYTSCHVRMKNGFERPYLVSGVMGIIDPVNREFFVLVMGGTD